MFKEDSRPIADIPGAKDLPFSLQEIAKPEDLSEHYEQLLSTDPQTRKQGGAYYTPQYIVDFIVEKTLGPVLETADLSTLSRLCILDPASGGGIFLLAAYRAVLARVRELCPKIDYSKQREMARSCLAGADKDKQAVLVANTALTWLSGSHIPVDTAQHMDSLTHYGNKRPTIIIGNPPWGQKNYCFSAKEKQQLKDNFQTAKGCLDPYALFVEQAIVNLPHHGRWGFILPDTILLKNQTKLRSLILRTCTIEWIVHATKPFPDANIDAAVLVATRKTKLDSQEKPKTTIWHTLPKQWQHSPPETHRIQSSVFSELPEKTFNIYLTGPSYQLIRRLSQYPTLADHFVMHEGVHTGNIRRKLFVRNDSKSRKKVIVGKDEIRRYRLQWNGTYIELDPSVLNKSEGEYASLGRSEWFTADKLVVRRTGDHIVCAADTQGFYMSNNAFVLLPLSHTLADTTNKHQALFAFVALLNSRLTTWYFRTIHPRIGKRFAEVKIKHLQRFPIPKQSSWNHIASELATIAQERACDEHNTPYCEKADALVANAFSLSRNEVRLIMETS